MNKITKSVTKTSSFTQTVERTELKNTRSGINGGWSNRRKVVTTYEDANRIGITVEFLYANGDVENTTAYHVYKSTYKSIKK